jgi:phosphoribosylaminoimidazolecarboxamide formyltransferase/IMP cyclohydrolase
MQAPQIQRALISVSDKTGLVAFAQGLVAAGVEIYSTGGTATHLRQANLPVRDVSEYTQFPEMMHGRLKTLHPKIFGGILARQHLQEDQQALQDHGILTFGLVVVNLYPFAETIARAGVTMAEAIEQIDIGGPSLVRAAAKNHAFITIATNASQYDEILSAVQSQGGTDLKLRQRLAGAAFAHTASYDQTIATYFAHQLESDSESSGQGPFPAVIQMSLERHSELRYGENPHQRAALYRWTPRHGQSLIDAEQLNGKELSYNNWLDLDSAWSIALSLPNAAASVIKHNNPCGAASANLLAEAAQKALDGDPVSAFGSIIGFNQTVDVATAEVLCAPGLFVEAIVAPRFDQAAIEMLTTRPKWRQNVRLMQVGEEFTASSFMTYRQIGGGMLLQDDDLQADPVSEWKVVTRAQPDSRTWNELQFGWAIVRHVKSNAIVVTRDQSLCGAGAGQMSRVDSVEIALQKAGLRASGAVLASDAFFPFPDSIERAAQAGIAAIIQPGGSKRDDEVIAACNERGIPMVFTGRRHFKH